jgi:hypothetical protein
MKEDEMGGACRTHGRHERYLKYLVEKNEWKSTILDWRIILKWILREQGERLWIRFNWLNIGTGGGLL